MGLAISDPRTPSALLVGLATAGSAGHLLRRSRVLVPDDRWADELVRLAALGLTSTAVNRVLGGCGASMPTAGALAVLDQHRPAFEDLPDQENDHSRTAVIDPAFLLDRSPVR